MAWLLDTHALLWWLSDDPALPQKARQIISDTRNEIFVSAASGWEIAIKKGLGKLQAPDNLDPLIEAQGFLHLPIRFAHGESAGDLPPLHRDPFDRMLVAQSMAHGLSIITRDPDIARYEVAIVWD